MDRTGRAGKQVELGSEEAGRVEGGAGEQEEKQKEKTKLN